MSDVGVIVSALPWPVVAIGADDRVRAANEGALRLLGRGMVGRHYITALRQPAVLDAIEAVRDGRGARAANYLGREGRRDSTWRVHVSPAGPLVLLVFEDRTAATETSQIRRDFVANVSHELKTPLTAILGLIETLRGPARADAAAQERFLATMEAEARRMDRLVADLLALSRVEAIERMRPTATVDLSALLRSVRDGLSPLAGNRGAALHLDLGAERLEAPGDAEQLRQVVTNLTENAVKYGASNVHLSLSREDTVRELRGPGLRLQVTDDGPGIESRHLPRLTERFYRVDTHRSRNVGGTGLGLAIAKHVVSRHRGRLRIASEVGKGTTVTVLLPANLPDSAQDRRLS